MNMKICVHRVHIQLCNFVIIFAVDSDLMSGVKKIFGSEEKKELVDPYFVFSFAGQEVIFRRGF